MYKTIWYIIKKECSRFLKDRHMIFMVIILPALLMYGIYTMMGAGLHDMMRVDENYIFRCYVQNAPASYGPIFDSLNFDAIEAENADSAKDSVAHKDADLVVIFPENFDNELSNSFTDNFVPNIQVYYNGDKIESLTAYKLFLSATEQLEASIANVLDVNRDVENPDLSSGSSMLLSFIPAMVVMLLFSSCASVAPESIAGEKERGTFATLLVTPISRAAIAMGKIISLSLFAILGGLSSFAGLILGTKEMLREVESPLPAYSSIEYALLLLLIISAVMMTISIISVVSAFSKSVKEANSSVNFVSIFGSIGGMATMLPLNFSGIWWRCVPVLGTAKSLNDLISMEYSVADIAVTCATNIFLTSILVFVLSKMFNSEKIMFSKA